MHVDNIVPVDRDMKTLRAIFKRHGVRYTQKAHPTTCPIHDRGPAQKIHLQNVSLKLANLLTKKEETDVADHGPIDSEIAALEAKQRKLTAAVKLFETHLHQYETARKAAKKAENLITPGSMVWYRDFVNQYDVDGNKIHDFVLVMMFRETPGGVIQKLVVHNLTSNPDTNICDALMVSDMVRHHLSGTSNVGEGLIKRQKAAGGGVLRIYQSGDHGPQLSSNDTLYDQTKFWFDYQVDIRDGFLCSYHAFNPCDAGGSIAVRLMASLTRSGKPTRGAHGLAYAINSSLYANHVAFYYAEINRPVDFFPKMVKLPRARKMCDIRYDHYPPPHLQPVIDQPTLVSHQSYPLRSMEYHHTVGVVRARLVSEQGAYTVWDLLPRDKATWGTMCEVCSNAFQCPIYHKKDGSTCPQQGATRTLNRQSIVQPSASRLAGTQDTRIRHGFAKQLRGAFPCKASIAFPPGTCPRHHYKQRAACNKHMQKVHGDLIAAGTIKLYEFEEPNSTMKCDKADKVDVSELELEADGELATSDDISELESDRESVDKAASGESDVGKLDAAKELNGVTVSEDALELDGEGADCQSDEVSEPQATTELGKLSHGHESDGEPPLTDETAWVQWYVQCHKNAGKQTGSRVYKLWDSARAAYAAKFAKQGRKSRLRRMGSLARESCAGSVRQAKLESLKSVNSGSTSSSQLRGKLIDGKKNGMTKKRARNLEFEATSARIKKQLRKQQ